MSVLLAGQVHERDKLSFRAPDGMCAGASCCTYVIASRGNPADPRSAAMVSARADVANNGWSERDVGCKPTPKVASGAMPKHRPMVVLRYDTKHAMLCIDGICSNTC